MQKIIYVVQNAVMQKISYMHLQYLEHLHNICFIIVKRMFSGFILSYI